MTRIVNGSQVRFVGDLDRLLAGLPGDEVTAIRAAVTSQPFRVTSLNADGPIEIELSLHQEIHFFYVHPTDVVPIG